MEEDEIALEEILVEPEQEERAASPAQRALRYLTEKGLSREDAAAMVWNFTQESGPNLQTNLVHDAGTGYGIAGFRDPVPGLGRRSNLFRHAGTRSPSLEQQLDFALHELQTSENKTFQKMLAAKTPEEKAAAAIGYFRPRADYASDRARRAGEVLALLNGGGSTAPRGPSTSIATAALQEPSEAGAVQTEEVIPEAPTQITVNPQQTNFLQDLIASQTLDVNPAVQQAPEPSFLETLIGNGQQSLGVNPQYALDVPDPAQITQPDQGLLTELEQLRYAPEPIPGGAGPNPIASPAEIAAGRMAQSARPQGGRLEGGATKLTETGAIPAMMLAPFSLPAAAVAGLTGDLSSPLSAAAAVSAIPGVGPTAKVAALATGATLDTFGADANAAPRRSLMSEEQKKAAAAQRKLEQQTRMRNAAEPTINNVVGELNATGNKPPGHNVALYSLLGASAVGLIGFPILKKIMPNGQVRKMRSVLDAPPGTLDPSTVGDLAAAQHNVWAGVTRQLYGIGAPPAAVKEIEKTFGFQTRAAANSLVNQAAKSGKVETVAYKFESKVPLDDLAKTDAPDVRQYLYLKAQQEASLRADKDIFTESKILGHMGEKIKGKYADEYAREAWHLEKANPQLLQIHRGVQEHNKAMADFLTKGEYSTVGGKQAKDLYKAYKSHIPYDKGTDPLTQNPFDVLRRDMDKLMIPRMENEPRVMLIDEARKVDKGIFNKIDDIAQYRKDVGTHHDKNIVKVYRAGVPEYYATNPLTASIYNTDVYHHTGIANEAAWLTKRAFERTTTHDLNPLFAPIAMMRNYFQAKFTTPDNRKAPTFIGSFMTAPVQQVAPQFAKYIERSLNEGWIGRQFPPDIVQPLSQKLGQWYANSQFAEMEKMGAASSGAYSYTYQQATNKIAKLIEGSNEHSAFYQGYLNTLEALNNAASFNYYRRNVSRVPDRKALIQESRNLTGNPRTRGQYWMDNGAPLRFEGSGTLSEKIAEPLTRAYGATVDWGIHWAPWTNIIQQSMKSVAHAYADHPVRFTAKAWQYAALPAATGYMAAVGLDKDPNGRSYVDYMMNGRSNRQQAGYIYLPLPGVPAEQGMEIPYPQELGIVGGMSVQALHHLFYSYEHANRGTAGAVFNNLSRSRYFSEEEDMSRLLGGWQELAGQLPTPPIASAIVGQLGKTGIGGEVLGKVFGNSWNVPNEDKFDDTPGLSKGTEQMIRALVPSIVDYVGTAARAFAHSEWGEDPLQATLNAGTAVKNLAKSKVPFIGGYLSEKPLPGNSAIDQEYFKRKREIDDLIRFSRSSDTVSDPVGVSDSGKTIARTVLGVPLPRELAGITPSEPTNPLYSQFISVIDARFAHDSAYSQRAGKMTEAEKKAKQGKGGEEKGGIGFKAVLDQHRVASAQVASMKKVDPGNAGTWLFQMPDSQKEYLKSVGVDHTNRNAVLSHYQQKTTDARRVILFMIRATEDKISKELGQPVTLRDLSPYAKAPSGSSPSPANGQPGLP